MLRVHRQGGALPFLWELNTPFTDWFRIAPTGQELSHGRFGDWVMQAVSLQDGSNLLLFGMPNIGVRAVRSDDSESPPVDVRMPMEMLTGSWSISSWRGQGAFVTNLNNNKTVWHVQDGTTRAVPDQDLLLNRIHHSPGSKQGPASLDSRRQSEMTLSGTRSGWPCHFQTSSLYIA